MSVRPTPSLRRSIAILEEGHATVAALYGTLPSRARRTPGLGGGSWSPTDLIGHLETWEAFALAALDAWGRGHGPAFEKELWSKGTRRVNRGEVERKAARSAPEMVRRAEATHAVLIERLAAMTDAAWRRPGTARARKSVGERLGGILGGPAGPFRHAEAHLRDLRAFAEEHGG